MNRKIYLCLIALCLIPLTAWANVGVPFIFVTPIAFVLGLLGVTAIEAFIIKRCLKISPSRAIASSTLANIVSTIIGMFLKYAYLQVVAFGGNGQSLSGLVTSKANLSFDSFFIEMMFAHVNSMSPISMLILIVPFFFISWISECAVTKIICKKETWKSVRSATLKANLVTYILFAILPVSLLIIDALNK